MRPDGLETSRLYLRQPRAADFDDCLAMRSVPEVVRYIGNVAATSEDVWARLLRYAGHWQWLGYGYWIVCTRDGDRFVGEVGLGEFRRGLGEDFDGRPEIGWVLAPWAQGLGFATEAARAALDWSDARWPGAATVCLVSEDNAASLGVAAKCGYVEMRRAAYKSSQAVLLSRAP